MANKLESSSNSLRTSALVVKIKAIFSRNNMISKQKKRPTMIDCITETLVANFAPLPLPAPSSLATLTLKCESRGKSFRSL